MPKLPLQDKSSLTLREALSSTHKIISPLDATLILAFLLKKDRVFLLAHDDKKLTHTQTKKFLSLVRQRAKNIPLAYLIGRKEFFGLDFFISQDVLVPRPETEELVELVLSDLPLNSPAHILDCGTGSGIIAITLATLRKRCSFMATDTSIKALQVAKKNSRAFQVSNRITFTHASLVPSKTKPFTHVVANLPYLDPRWTHKSISHEPRQALFTKERGLFLYKKLLSHLPAITESGSRIYCELDPRNIHLLAKEIRKNKKFTSVVIHRDLAGRKRFLTFSCA